MRAWTTPATITSATTRGPRALRPLLLARGRVVHGRLVESRAAIRRLVRLSEHPEARLLHLQADVAADRGPAAGRGIRSRHAPVPDLRCVLWLVQLADLELFHATAEVHLKAAGLAGALVGKRRLLDATAPGTDENGPHFGPL